VNVTDGSEALFRVVGSCSRWHGPVTLKLHVPSRKVDSTVLIISSWALTMMWGAADCVAP